MEPHRRRRVRTVSLALAGWLVLVLGLGAGRAEAAEHEPGPAVERAAFDDGLEGWRGHRARLSLAPRGVEGGAALVRLRWGHRHAPAFAIYRPLLLPGTSRGTLYRASAWGRASRGGEPLCLRVRELVHGRTIGLSVRCVPATGGWQRLRPVLYRAKRDLARLRVAVYRERGRGANRFWVDEISVVPVSGPGDTPPKPPGQPGGSNPRPAVGTQFHCMWDHYSNAERDAVLDKLKAAGVTWVRIDVGWLSLEYRGKGRWEQWHVDNLDYCVNAARARGLNVLGTFWATPSWANGGQAREVPPSNLQDYADAARWVAARYRDKVAAWEVWNEPDPWVNFWQGSVAQYVSLLKVAYPAFKAGDPGTTVVLGGPSSNDNAWLQQIYEQGGGGSFDVVAMHPYQGIADQPPEANDDGNRWWFTHLPAVRSLMDARGDGGKPIWFTEFGWSAHSNWSGVPNWQRGVTADQQGDYFVRAIRLTQERYPYVPVMFWYKERAYPGGTDPHLEGFAILNSDLSERPVYGALRNFLTAP